MKLTPSQNDVLLKVKKFCNIEDEQLFLCSGAAGTGKTVVLSQVISLVRNFYRSPPYGEPLNIIVAAPTWKAAKVLQRKLPNEEVISLHSAVYEKPIDIMGSVLTELEDIIEKGISGKLSSVDTNRRDYLTSKLDDISQNSVHFETPRDLNNTVLIIDEARMVGSTIIHKAIEGGVTRIIAFGDHRQLLPVKDTVAFPLSQKADANLTEILRTGKSSDIPRISAKIAENKTSGVEVSKLLQPYTKGFSTPENKPKFTFEEMTALEKTCIIAFTHVERKRINKLYHDGDLKKGDIMRVFKTSRDVGANVRLKKVGDNYIAGDLFMFLNFVGNRTSDSFFSARLKSMETGIVKDVRINWEDVKPKKLSPSEVRKYIYDKDRVTFSLPYAMTCHMSQGSEFENVYISAKGYIGWSNWKKGLYTAITRASKNFTIEL